MKKWIKTHLWEAIVSSVLILLPMPVGICLWEQLTSRQIGLVGFTVYGLPLILLAIHWICLAATMADPKNRNQSHKIMSLLFWILPACSLFINGLLYMTILGNPLNTTLWAPAFFGILFVVIGNLLPKAKQNATVGIKVSWTLNNEENWNKTHRFSGKVWVISGFLLLLSLMLPGKLVMAVMLVVILAAILLPLLYSYLYYRKQKKNGTYVSSHTTQCPKAKALIVPAIICVGIAVIMFTGSVHVEMGQDSFTVKASYYADIRVAYADVDSIEYRDSIGDSSRTMGFGSARLLLGTFYNEEFGTFTRYTYAGNKPCVVLKEGNRTLVIGGKNQEETKKLFADLTARLDK